jgi:hypothetical protein
MKESNPRRSGHNLFYFLLPISAIIGNCRVINKWISPLLSIRIEKCISNEGNCLSVSNAFYPLRSILRQIQHIFKVLTGDVRF